MDRIAIDDEWDGYSPWRAIDRYQPCFELASGGMGTVFLARVTARAALHRFVALKRIHPHLVKEPGFVEMFLDEAHVASRIVHPNVCSVFDFDAEGGRPYIAMEYLMGETLTRVAQAVSREESPAAVERVSRLAARVVADACEGLHAAHELRDEQGELLHVVHRDVSPQNLFLTYDGAVKVVDFGLVRMAQCLHKTKPGTLKGKFGYLAPEALAHRPLDRRADVWGLGVVLWELVTGRRLFQRANEVDTVMAVANEPVPPPSTVRAGIPAELDAIVLCALARNPEDRYPTARAFGRDLLAFVHAGSEPVGLADLAEWMDQLFPRGRERKLELLEVAGQMLSERSDRTLPATVRSALRPPPPPAADVDTQTRALSRAPSTCSTRPQVPEIGAECTAQTPGQRSERPPPASRTSTLRPPAPAAAEPEAPAHAPPMVPLACSVPPGRPGGGPRWSARSAALAAFGLGAVLTAAGALAVTARRQAAAGSPPGGVPEAWRPLPAGVVAERIAGAQHATFSSASPVEASGGSCTPARDTMVLELVPPGEAEPRRILVRAVPPATRAQ